MAPLRLISLHLLLASWWWIAFFSLVVTTNAADFYDAEAPGSGGTTTTTTLGFSHEPDDVVVARGQSARLDCLVRLPPTPPVSSDQRNNNNGTSQQQQQQQQPPQQHLDEPIAFDIHWFQDGMPIVLPDSRRHILANGSLYFDKVLHKRSGRTSSDEGIYNCLAQQKQISSSNSGGGAFISRNVSVRVAVLAKEFTTWPVDATVETGDPARLACEIESVPEAEITWEKDGAPVVGSDQSTGGGGDEVNNNNGTDNRQLVVNGSSITSSAIQEEEKKPQMRFVSLESGRILHIYNVQSADAGIYRCVARNELADKERRSQAGRLLVVVNNTTRSTPTLPGSDGDETSIVSASSRLPQFISPPPPNDLWVVQGGNVTIECLATGTTNAAGVTWTLNSSSSSSSLTMATTDQTNGLHQPQMAGSTAGPGYLSLTDVNPSMAGRYTCVAITSTTAGSGGGGGGSSVAGISVTQSTHVHVATVPQFLRVPKSQVFPTAKTVRFECEVTGIPSPEIRWFKDGRIVPIGGRIKNRIRNGGTFSELVLSNTVTGDSGIYQCQAGNRAGVVSVSARLLVNVSEGTRPEPPSNLKAVALTPTSVVLTWDPPRNVPVDDVKAYTVHFMALLSSAGQHSSGGGTSSNNNEEHQDVAISSSHRIDNLKANANYSFYVRAYVRKSASDPSYKLIFNPAILIQSASTSSPTATAAVTQSPNSPSIDSKADPPDHLHPPPPPPPTTLPRPPPRTLPPTAPNVTLLPLTPNTLRVTWRRLGSASASSSSSSTSSSVSFYKIQYRRHRIKEFDIEVVKGDVHEYTITGLHPGRKYDVRVLPGSMNGAGPGQWYTVEMPRVMADAETTTTTTTTTTSPKLPASNPDVQLMAVNATSVLVTWDNVLGGRQPTMRGNQVQLTYRIQGSRETSPVVILPAASGSRWVTGLRAGSVYEFQLASRSDDQQKEKEEGGGGGGSWSVSSSIRTLWNYDSAAGYVNEEEDTESDPRPVRIEAKVLSSNAIQVSWHVLPPESASNVLYYTIRYVAIATTESSSEPVQKFQFVRCTGHQVQLSNLTAFTLYRISIRSHDRQGRSSTYSSPAADARTLADLPGPPLDLSFTVDVTSAGTTTTTTTTGQLFWKAPHPVRGNILGYAILISTDAEAPIDTWVRKEEPGVWLRSQLRGLDPATIYYVRMQARTSVGWGPLTPEPPLTCSFFPPNQPEGNTRPKDPDDRSTGNDPGGTRVGELYLGAFIGLAVSMILVTVCCTTVLLRTRCIKRMSPTEQQMSSQLAGSQIQQLPSAAETGAMAAANGLAVCNGGRFQPHRLKKEQQQQQQQPLRRNGSLRNSSERSVDASTMLEMESFVPMLATIPVDDMPSHLDTKGGYPSGSRASVAGRIITPLMSAATIGMESTMRKEADEDDDDDDDDADRSELPLLSLSHSVVGQQHHDRGGGGGGGGLDGTILSQATETTCLSLDYSGRNRRRRRRKHHHHLRRQGSLHSHDDDDDDDYDDDDDDEGDSSLHSLDSRTTTSNNSQRQQQQQQQQRSSSEAISCTSDSSSSNNSRRSLREEEEEEDNDTGICHTDHHHHQMMNDSGLVVAVMGSGGGGGVASVVSSSSNNNRSQTTTTTMLTPKGTGDQEQQQQLVIST